MDNNNKSSFQFSNPVMLESHFVIHKDYDAKHMDGALDTPIKISFSRPNATDSQDNRIFAQLTVEAGQDDNTFPFYISVTMGADFRWDKSLALETVNQMLSRNAPMLLLAYARPLVAQLTGASPTGPVHIPYMNFLQQNSEQE